MQSCQLFSKKIVEMEFLDISLTKGSSLLLYAVCSPPLLLEDFKKTILFSGSKNPNKKIRETRKSSRFMNSILQNGKMRVENLTKLKSENSNLCLETSTKNAVQEFHLGYKWQGDLRSFKRKCFFLVQISVEFFYTAAAEG